MTVQHNLKEQLVNDFNNYEAGLNGDAKSELHRIRKNAIDSFAQKGFPTTQLEDWKYTNLNSLAKKSFQSNFTTNKQPTSIDISKFLIPDLKANMLVFENGWYREDLSTIIDEAEGLVIGNLSKAFKYAPQLISDHFTKYADHTNEAMVALNTGLAQDGLFVHIPDKHVLAHPVYVLQIANTEKGATIASPRSLIIGGENSQAKVLQHFVSLNETAESFSNSVIEIYAGTSSRIDHFIVQDEAATATNLTETQTYLSKQSHIHCHNYSLEGGLIRNKTNMVIADEHSEAHMYGAYVLNENQHADNRSLVDHSSANAFSQELYKGVLGGKSKGVFNGRIMVRRDAQKTNAYQTNRNILVSDDAQIFTKPQLEIFADDVRCSHGCTIGQLDEEAIFYLRSRGLSLKQAKTYLLKAFVGEVVLKVGIEPLKDYLIEKIDEKIKGMMV